MGSTKRVQATGIFLMAFGLAVAIAGAQQPAPSPSAADDNAQPDAAPVVSAPPEAPVMAPKVVCAGNEMTISANNSTLSSVLAEVHRCMGTRIDIPDAAGAKHMYDKIGPGPASQVLDILLSNTGYNYVIGASPANEDKIDSIVLLARNSDGATPPVVDDPRAGTTSRRAFMQMHQAAIPHPMTEEDNAAAAQLAPADAPKPAAPAADTQPASTTPPADAAAKPADAAPAAAETPTPPTPTATPNSYSSHPTTTEEQIVNMQQMFELRKQMNQQQNTAPQNGSPQP